MISLGQQLIPPDLIIIMQERLCFTSYRGGVGKTTILINLAASLAKEGYRVAIVDLDFYKPGVWFYLGKNSFKIDYSIQDYILELCDAKGTFIDLKPVIQSNSKETIRGEIILLSASLRIQEMDTQIQQLSKLNKYKKLIDLVDKLGQTYKPDYILIDSHSGITEWTTCAMALSKFIMITLNPTQIDVLGTELVYRAVEDLGYGGYRPILFINNVVDNQSSSNRMEAVQLSLNDLISTLSSKTRVMRTYCIIHHDDIQFSEFLTVLRNPSHPFSSQVRNMELLFK